ncbi:hemin-degrading factor [Jannaschia sp. CCS1]|uniref:hemin-degrading factor n=1 Tax=Jannaschia sp. (strain CCS1) TaxID=290400 RepID=UPI000053C4CF|nr:hemin-degrading factor [Jannaschia sp. CCS1]ABD55050.1 hemin-degrading [Jannaschia sp. CCS1]
MGADTLLSATGIRAAIADNPKTRPRDLADTLGVPEAALLAAQIGYGGVPMVADTTKLIPAICTLGEVMALTRNDSAVHEKIGVYDNFHPGDHASSVLTADIDLRLFSRHWVHAFAMEKEVDGTVRRSVQVFDAAGDAVHKVILRERSNIAMWDVMLRDLEGPDATPVFEDRTPPEAPTGDLEKADILRAEWSKMTDTHQFMRLTSKLKMNRLGAYRIAGAPHVVALAPSAMTAALEAMAEGGVPIMMFVGNRGCIQIHSGPIHKLVPMGPWQNVMDPGFNLHLRADHVAEVWLVNKPTKRGPAISVEAFDARGALILQCFAYRKEGQGDNVANFRALTETLPRLAQSEEVA